MAYYTTKANDDDILPADWNAFVDQAVEPSGHQHSGAAQDGNSALLPTQVAITQTSTELGLSVTRDNSSGAATLFQANQDNESDSSDAGEFNTDGEGNTLILKYKGVAFATFKNGAVDVEGIIGYTYNRENKVGSDCSLTDGDVDRVLTLANTTLETSEERVYLDGQFLEPVTDYTANHLEASSTITFLTKVWDDQIINVLYTT